MLFPNKFQNNGSKKTFKIYIIFFKKMAPAESMTYMLDTAKASYNQNSIFILNLQTSTMTIITRTLSPHVYLNTELIYIHCMFKFMFFIFNIQYFNNFLATAFKMIASHVIFLFHRVIKEEYCIQIFPNRKNTCENHTFYHTTNAYNFCEVPVSVQIVQCTYQNLRC